MPSIRMPLVIAAALLLDAPHLPIAMRHLQPEVFAATGALVNALADIDGDADLFVGFNGTPNRLYRNDGGVFVEMGSPAAVPEQPWAGRGQRTQQARPALRTWRAGTRARARGGAT